MSDAMTLMPMYVSHKEVWALKIKSIQLLGPNGDALNPDDATEVMQRVVGVARQWFMEEINKL